MCRPRPSQSSVSIYPYALLHSALTPPDILSLFPVHSAQPPPPQGAHIPTPQRQTEAAHARPTGTLTPLSDPRAPPRAHQPSKRKITKSVCREGGGAIRANAQTQNQQQDGRPQRFESSDSRGRLRDEAPASDPELPQAARGVCQHPHDCAPDPGAQRGHAAAQATAPTSWLTATLCLGRPQALKIAGVNEVVLAINYQPEVRSRACVFDTQENGQAANKRASGSPQVMYNFINEWQEKLGVKIVCSQARETELITFAAISCLGGQQHGHTHSFVASACTGEGATGDSWATGAGQAAAG